MSQAPRQLGRYTLGPLLGRGGMGRVFQADLRGPAGFRKRVALKLLGGKAALPEDAARTALAHEARLGALLSHPNVVATYDLGLADGIWYVAMELVDGATAAALAAAHPLPPAALLDLGAQACAGLAHIHGLRVEGRPASVVHRDIKPRNLLVDRSGLVKIADLGIARLAGAESDGSGTAGYAAPEQLEGRAEARSDLFSLGCTLFALATGQRLFPGGAQGMLAVNRTEESLADPAFLAAAESRVRGLAPLLARCLRRDVADRWRSATELERALRRLAMRFPPTPVLRDLVAACSPVPQAPPSREEDVTLPTLTGGSQRTRDRPPDPFVGRQDDLEAVLQGLRTHRVVTLVGTGGVGKTRLALEAAAKGDGVATSGTCFVDLSETSTLEALCAAVADALAVPLSGPQPLVQLSRALANRGHLLLVLDNVEQVIGPAAEAVAAWVQAAAALSVLLTSRTPLRVRAEHVLTVEPLPVADGIRLFAHHAARAGPPEVQAEIVRRLDGLPLAIELAAARTRVLTPHKLLERLDERFKVLTGGGRDRPARHATLRASIDASWELLQPAERSALAQLSVFAGGWTLEAADAVLDLQRWAGLWALDVLAALLEHSLIRVDGDRFRMLATLRAYAADQLALDRGAQRAAERRHGAYYAELGHFDAIQALYRHGGPERRRRLEEDVDNLVIATTRAIDRGDGTVAGLVGTAAVVAMQQRGPFQVAVALGERVLTLDLEPLSEVRLLGSMHRALIGLGRLEVAIRLARRARTLCQATGDPYWTGRGDLMLASAMIRHRETDARALVASGLAAVRAAGDPTQEATGLMMLATVCSRTGEAAEAEEALRRCIAILRRIGYVRGAASAVGNLGLVLYRQGRLAEATELLEQAIEAFGEARSTVSAAGTMVQLGLAYHPMGRLDEAEAWFHRGLQILRRVGDREREATTLGHLALIDADRGLHARAIDGYREALALAREVCSGTEIAAMVNNLGLLLQDVGQIDAARAAFEEAMAGHEALGDRRGSAIALGNLAAMQRDEGHLDLAERIYARVLEAHRQVGNRRSEAHTLMGIGLLLAAQGRHTEARASLEQALALQEELGAKLAACLTRIELAELARTNGDAAGAAALLDPAEPILRGSAAKALAGLLCVRARLALDRGDRDAARRYLAEADALDTDPAVRGDWAEALAALHEALQQPG